MDYHIWKLRLYSILFWICTCQIYYPTLTMENKTSSASFMQLLHSYSSERPVICWQQQCTTVAIYGTTKHIKNGEEKTLSEQAQHPFHWLYGL